jgi:hypothetical protein
VRIGPAVRPIFGARGARLNGVKQIRSCANPLDC